MRVEEILRRDDVPADVRLALAALSEVGGCGRTPAEIAWDYHVAAVTANLARALTDPSLGLDGIAEATLASACELTASEHGFVATIDRRTGAAVAHMLIGRAGTPDEPERRRVTFKRDADGRFPSLWGHSFSERADLYTNDPSGHPQGGPQPAGHPEIRSFLTVPAVLGGDALGQIALANTPSGYADRHLEAIRRLSGLLALAIQRERVMGDLRSSLSLYSGLYGSAVGGVSVHDREGRIVEANDAACEIFGFSREQLFHGDPSYPAWQAVHEDGSRFEPGTSPLRATLRTGLAQRDVVMGLPDPDDGSTRWVLTNCEPLRDAGTGELQGAVATFVDVTRLKQAEAGLRRNAEQLRALVKTSHVPMLIVDRDMRILLANDAFTRATGYTSDDIPDVEAWWAKAYPDPEYRDKVRAGWLERLEGARSRGGSVPAAEVWVTGGDGRRLLMRVGMTPLGERNLVVLEDLTDRRRAEEGQRLAAVGQLAAGVAHDFNNLLMAMSLAAEVANSSEAPEDYRRLSSVVGASTRRGADLCRNLMAFARPGEPQTAPTSLESAIDEALGLAARETEAVDVTVTRDYGEGRRAVLADSAQLQQVFLNIIINACHAMPGGGTLRVATSYGAAGTSTATARFTDTGTGMSEETLARVFEPFFTTKGRLGESDTPGAGLGLSVSHGIVTAHGGTIRLTSAPGRGTTAEVSLPLSTSPATLLPQTPRRLPEAPPDTRHRVLVADDEQPIRDLIGIQLSLEGVEAVLAADTHEALAALRSHRFDAILSDLMMPGGGAREVLAALSETADAPPVIVMTGRLEQSLRDELLGRGAAACLAKPFQRDDLVSALAEALAPR
jgi:PAS domain S-box-containing protein